MYAVHGFWGLIASSVAFHKDTHIFHAAVMAPSPPPLSLSLSLSLWYAYTRTSARTQTPPPPPRLPVCTRAAGEARTAEAVAERKGEEMDEFVSGPKELLLKLVEECYPLPPDPYAEDVSACV
jgi:hypothetical protein